MSALGNFTQICPPTLQHAVSDIFFGTPYAYNPVLNAIVNDSVVDVLQSWTGKRSII